MTTPPDIRIARAIAEHQAWRDRMRHGFQVLCEIAEIETQQARMLVQLYAVPEGAVPTVSYLAIRLRIKPHTCVSLVSRAEQSGWVEKQKDEKDSRKVLVSLTEEGCHKAVLLMRAHISIYESLGPSTIEAFAQVIDSIRLYDVHEEVQVEEEL